jgi:hypothetical protein
MSSQSATGSRDAVQDTLNAIMRRLDNIKLKLEPLQPLQMRMEALEAAVTDQDRAVHRIEMAQSAPSSHRPLPRARRGTRDDENGDPSHNSHSTDHKASVTHCHG